MLSEVGSGGIDPPRTSLDGDTLPGRLRTTWLGRVLIHRARVDSTNDEARRLADAGAVHGTVVVADEQTDGRGRLGRAWHSPAGDNLYLSAVLRPSGLAPAAAPPLGLAAAVGLAEGVSRGSGIAVAVKWPNDLLCGERKLAGILVELAAEADRIRQVIVGIGINVNGRTFPDPLSARATSLALQRGQPVCRSALLVEVLGQLEQWIDRLLEQGPAPVIEAWLHHARGWLGRPVEVHTRAGITRGVALGLDASGALRLRDAQGHEQRVLAGDLRLPPALPGDV